MSTSSLCMSSIPSLKIKPAIQFFDEPADALNSQIYSAWPMTSCSFLVSFTCQSIGCINIFEYFQALLSLLREFSLMVITPFLSDMLASMQTLFIFLCLLRSGCTLLVLRPMPSCIIEQPRFIIFSFVYF